MNAEIYKKTLEFQKYLREHGIAWHNFYANECTIDFDCCEGKAIGKVPVTISAPSERIVVKTAFENLFEEIKHGDQEHQDWLKEKMDKFLNENYQ